VRCIPRDGKGVVNGDIPERRPDGKLGVNGMRVTATSVNGVMKGSILIKLRKEESDEVHRIEKCEQLQYVIWRCC